MSAREDRDDPLAELRSPISPVRDAETAAAQRARVVSRLRELQVARPLRTSPMARFRKHPKFFGVLAFASAAAAVCVMVVTRNDGNVTGAPSARPTHTESQRVAAVIASHVTALGDTTHVTRANQALAVGAERDLALEPMDSLRTARAGANVTLRGGATLALAASTDLDLLGDEPGVEAVKLARGEIFVSVPKLASGSRFSVRTPDTIVTVHGTRFTVSVDVVGARWRTRVRVTEGRVGVEHDGHSAELLPGESWSSLEMPTESSQAHRQVAAADHGAARSTLAEENALLERAMDARRAGDDGRALSLLDEYLAKYPRSPLGRNAALERLRSLQHLGSPAAKGAARRYLARFADGMGSDEARRIASESMNHSAPAASASP